VWEKRNREFQLTQTLAYFISNQCLLISFPTSACSYLFLQTLVVSYNPLLSKFMYLYHSVAWSFLTIHCSACFLGSVALCYDLGLITMYDSLVWKWFTCLRKLAWDFISTVFNHLLISLILYLCPVIYVISKEILKKYLIFKLVDRKTYDFRFNVQNTWDFVTLFKFLFGYGLWQVSCKFVNLTRWKVAICGEYMKSGYKV
jgi:hypothetical protein